MTDIAASALATPKRRLNWWKIGFFVALIAFEGAREWAVVQTNANAQPFADGRVFSFQGYVSAEGTWKRIDGGDPILPGLTTLQCEQDQGRCYEASVRIDQRMVWTPDLTWYPATFMPTEVSYINDTPECVRYTVKIDTVLKKVFAVREKKAGAPATCGKFEPRMELQLTSSFGDFVPPTRDHFLPLLAVAGAVFKLIDWV